jgi:hypothetical protein
MENQPTEEPESKKHVAWRTVYLIVLGFLILQILVYAVITSFYA